MGLLNQFATDVIKWEPGTSEEGADLVVHKYEYEDFVDGAYLMVAPSQMAVFVNYMGADTSTNVTGEGKAPIMVFKGPEKIKLETGNPRFAPFRNIRDKLTGGESAFHCTVYFINTAYMTELNWGTQEPFPMTDPEESTLIHVRAYGLFGAHIEKEDPTQAVIDANCFLQRVVGTRADFTRKELINFMRAKVGEYVPDTLANEMLGRGIGILSVTTKLTEFSQILQGKLYQHFKQFGLTLDNFSFNSIKALDEDIEKLSRRKDLRMDAMAEGQAEGMKEAIKAQFKAQAMTSISEAEAAKRQREGYTYQQEAAYGVMQSAASNESSGNGFMNAGMGLGMGVGLGGAMGMGMSNIANQTMAGMGNVANQATAGMVPPPPGMVPPTPGMVPPSQVAGAVCPACGKSNPEGAKFCLECGEKFQTAPTCPDCGKELVSGAKFCPFCGKKMGGPATCPKCGAELAEGAKFCLQCGEKI